MARDTTVQFILDSTVKDDPFAVVKEMGITPSEAGYAQWLKAST
jgi:antitoxin component of RelBE/YafQ-DinJ toxin-antitoxin module